jgi:hypothetical protein
MTGRLNGRRRPDVIQHTGHPAGASHYLYTSFLGGHICELKNEVWSGELTHF